MNKKDETLVAEILKIKKEKDYLIMAHNYQLPEIQDLADVTGDSLELAKKALQLDSRKILFLGVDFMAETIKILNPKKKILVAKLDATCPMANSLSVDKLLEIKKAYPSVPVVLYVNSTAQSKVYADYTCTSANAVEIVKKIPSDKVIFGPDKNLGSYVREQTGKEIILAPGEDGFCYVHNDLSEEDIKTARNKYPEAVLMVHPEVGKTARDLCDYIGSTGGMAKYPPNSSANEFIVGTEIGMVHKLQKLYPDRKFYPVKEDMICHNMKKTNLQNVKEALLYENTEIQLDAEVMEKAKAPILNMFSLMEK
jgi:quinolinate synthase